MNRALTATALICTLGAAPAQTGWILRTPAVSPPPRGWNLLSYDLARGVTVLFGGYSGFGDTWEWNGSNWAQRAPAHSPSPRCCGAHGYDLVRNRIVLFGGLSGAGDLNDTWEYDGNDWLQIVTPLAPSPRLVAFGQDAGAQERCRAARSADELRTIAHDESLAIDGTIDFAKELVVVLWFGDGRGGRPTIAALTDLTPEPRRLLRIAGAVGGPRVPGRWAAFTLPAAWEPWRTTTWFETDATAIAGDPVWREVLSGRAPGIVVPMATIRGELQERLQCFTDAAAFYAFGKARGGPVPFVPDFARQVVLVVADAGPSLYLLGGDFAPGQGRTVVRRWAPPAAPDSERTFGWFVVPRRDGIVDFEEPVSGSPGHSRVVASFPIAALATSARLQVARAYVCDLPAQATTRCERATTLAEWQELKKSLGGPVAKVPDDWCDFEHYCVVAVAVAEWSVLPGLGFAVTEEEGVDVLSVTQTAPSGRDQALRLACVVLQVPRRKGQLSVVFRRDTGPATGAEQTLRVFPGF